MTLHQKPRRHRGAIFALAVLVTCPNLAWAQNADCNVVVRGNSLINGKCNVVLRDQEMYLQTVETQWGFPSIPARSLWISMDETGTAASYVGFYDETMNRYGDLHNGPLVPVAGTCIQTDLVQACYTLMPYDPEYTLLGYLQSRIVLQNNAALEDAFGGASETDRRATQRLLADEGYYLSEVDGNWGPGTQRGLQMLDEFNSVKNAAVGVIAYGSLSQPETLVRFMEMAGSDADFVLTNAYVFCENSDYHLMDAKEKRSNDVYSVIEAQFTAVANEHCEYVFREEN